MKLDFLIMLIFSKIIFLCVWIFFLISCIFKCIDHSKCHTVLTTVTASVLTICHSKGSRLVLLLLAKVCSRLWQQDTLFHAGIQESEFLLAGTLLVSRIWSPPPASLPLGVWGC